MFSLVHRYEEIKSRAGSVGMLVYMDLASQVKRRAPGGSVSWVIMFLNSNESLKSDGCDEAMGWSI